MATAITDKPLTARSITEEQIQEYRRLDSLRLEHAAKARNYERKLDMIAGHFRNVLTDLNKQRLRRLGYDIMLVDGRRYPKWKDEFIRIAGPDEAQKVEENTQPTKQLKVEPID